MYDLYILKLNYNNTLKGITILKNWLEADYGMQLEALEVDEEMFNIGKRNNSIGIRISTYVIPRFLSIEQDWLSLFIEKNDQFTQVLDKNRARFYISTNNESEETKTDYSIKDTLKGNMFDIIGTDTYIRKENDFVTERKTSTRKFLYDGSTYQEGKASNEIPCQLC